MDAVRFLKAQATPIIGPLIVSPIVAVVSLVLTIGAIALAIITIPLSLICCRFHETTQFFLYSAIWIIGPNLLFSISNTATFGIVGCCFLKKQEREKEAEKVRLQSLVLSEEASASTLATELFKLQEQQKALEKKPSPEEKISLEQLRVIEGDLFLREKFTLEQLLNLDLERANPAPGQTSRQKPEELGGLPPGFGPREEDWWQMRSRS